MTTSGSSGFIVQCLVPGCEWAQEIPVEPLETWPERANAVLDGHAALHRDQS